MNVKDLIEELSKYDQSMPVCFRVADGDDETWVPARFVMETQPLDFDANSTGDYLIEPEDDQADNDAINYIAIE